METEKIIEDPRKTMERMKRYATLVKAMRSAQVDYFKAVKQKLWQTASAHLKTSKQLEKEVDYVTNEIARKLKSFPGFLF